ncbi:rhoptry neck protein 11 [Babesia ovata]|uniref:Rhoptry neck protein 11 n=1 Tax=Babesia ovata TaxID=189622 RepID=A0A2H6KFQ0_9APIC|nr:rhoptry neck protein 11 [Babesia ovata]GBE61821.1 rhoptry neck protein 11 [Babesia ovata]
MLLSIHPVDAWRSEKGLRDRADNHEAKGEIKSNDKTTTSASAHHREQHANDAYNERNETPKGNVRRNVEAAIASSALQSETRGLHVYVDRANSEKQAEIVYQPAEGFLNTAYFNTLLVIFAILVLVLTLVADIEMRIQSKDEFMRQAFDNCVRQVALMSFVTLSLYIAMHTDLAKRLDELFVQDSKHLEVFDALMQISFFLFCCFFVYCIYIGIVVSRWTKFMRKADEADVLTSAKEFDFVNGSQFIWNRNVINKARYMVNRMEFGDAVKQRGYSDVGGCYFMDYLRASLIQIAMTLIRISRVSLFVALSVLIVLRFIGPVHIMRTIHILSFLNTAAVVALAWRIWYIESHLYPPELSQYMLLKLNVSDVGEALQPTYKGGNEYAPSNIVQYWICGDAAINAHENLFWLKQHGPIVLRKAFEALLFCHLMILSVWLYCLKNNAKAIIEDYDAAAPLVGTVIVAVLAPSMLYSLVIVTRCGNLIDYELLEKVLTSHKNENAKNALQLIDSLAMEAIIFALEKGGDDQWRKLLAKQKALPDAITSQIKSHWNSMKNVNDEIKFSALLKYLQSQWGNFRSCNQQRMKEFVKQFMRHDPKTMNCQEFMVFGYAIKSMILTPLEEEYQTALFEDKFEIPWRSPCGVDLNNFDTIITQVAQWPPFDFHQICIYEHFIRISRGSSSTQRISCYADFYKAVGTMSA